LTIALGLTLGYMLAEVIGGLAANSLALIADAGHMMADAVAIGLALLAMWISARPASITRTFGFQRVEVLAALFNALSLWMITVWIFIEAYWRIVEPGEVRGLLMLAVGAGGLMINLAVAWTLHRSAQENLNVESAFLHVVGDLLGSIAVVMASGLIAIFGWFIVDPIFSFIIGGLILFSGGRLLWRVSHVLMEGTPSHVNLHELCQRLELEAGITGVHDIHAWSITSGYDAFSAHVTRDLSTGESADEVLSRLRDITSREFGISHSTIQLEESPEGCLEDHHIEHPAESRLIAEGPGRQNRL
jgi:cobalt-zinc-cadmium efflux system protein